ncbi:MAG: phosphatase [Coriobacteriia bacterium]|nr:phosphatase [Coriobacteriia bacterium]
MQGIIDIGSNSMRLSMYDTDAGDVNLLFTKKTMASLAADIDEEGNLTQGGIDKAVETLEGFSKFLTNLDDPPVSVIATASLRNINNTQEAIASIEQATGFQIILLSGTEEAHYDFEAIRWGMRHSEVATIGDFIVVDIGGGSTELVICNDGQIREGISLPIGSLNQFMRKVDHLIPTKANRCEIEQIVLEYLTDEWTTVPPHEEVIVVIGGTGRAALKLYNAHFGIDHTNNTMEVDQLRALIKTFKPRKKESIVRLVRHAPERLHSLLPGMVILQTIAGVVSAHKIVISNWGVREGYLIHMMGKGEDNG